MSFWDKTKQAVNNAAEATKIAAKKAKLKTEIQSIQMKIKDKKNQFGVNVYPFLETGKDDDAQKLFQETKTVIDGWKKEIQDKENEYAALGGKKEEISAPPESDPAPAQQQ